MKRLKAVLSKLMNQSCSKLSQFDYLNPYKLFRQGGQRNGRYKLLNTTDNLIKRCSQLKLIINESKINCIAKKCEKGFR